MKIAIIGNAGSGKSTLAYKLHLLLGIPLYHLDQHFWKPGWQEPDPLEFAKIHTQLCNQGQWIIEGIATRNFEYRAAQADIIFFLDIPTYLCLYRVYKRAFMHFGKVCFSSAPGCPERGPDFRFLKFILTFNRIRRPMIKAVLHTYKDIKKIFIIRNTTELNMLIKKF